MLEEAKAMIRVAKHDHIVNFQGISIDGEKVYVLLEFCSFGAVDGFLWFVVVSDTGMVEPKAVVVVVSPELTLILVSKASTSCPDY